MEAKQRTEEYADLRRMASSSPRRQITERDISVFTTLDRCPLTAEQLLRVSNSFAQPFTSLRRVQERLRQLTCSRLIQSWWYTSSTGCPVRYHKLSPATYRLLHGPDTRPRSKQMFSEISPSRHRHTQALADFIVHTTLAANFRGLRIRNFHGEDRLRVDIGEEYFFPDASFQLVSPADYRFNFFVEVDCGTETVYSDRLDVDHWQRKLHRYIQLHQSGGRRFRLLVVAVTSEKRLQNILDLAGRMTKGLDFRLVYGTLLADYLATADALFKPCFLSPDNREVSLLTHLARHEQPPKPFLLATPLRA